MSVLWTAKVLVRLLIAESWCRLAIKVIAGSGRLMHRRHSWMMRVPGAEAAKLALEVVPGKVGLAFSRLEGGCAVGRGTLVPFL